MRYVVIISERIWINMENKSFNRYNSLKASFLNLKMSQNADIDEPFVLPATVQNFNLTFDLSWKVMKDLVTNEFGFTDFASGSPRETLKTAFSVKLIDSDLWMEMLRVRNTLAHDYDGLVAKKYFETIVNEYIELIEQFIEVAKKYY